MLVKNEDEDENNKMKELKVKKTELDKLHEEKKNRIHTGKKKLEKRRKKNVNKAI